MITELREMDVREDAWVLEKNQVLPGTIKKLAIECVLLDLYNTFEREQGSEITKLEDSVQLSYWSGDSIYSGEDILRLYLPDCNNTDVVFDSMYITSSNHIILVAHTVPDIWEDSNVILDYLETSTPTYYLVSY